MKMVIFHSYVSLPEGSPGVGLADVFLKPGGYPGPGLGSVLRKYHEATITYTARPSRGVSINGAPKWMFYKGKSGKILLKYGWFSGASNYYGTPQINILDQKECFRFPGIVMLLFWIVSTGKNLAIFSFQDELWTDGC